MQNRPSPQRARTGPCCPEEPRATSADPAKSSATLRSQSAGIASKPRKAVPLTASGKGPPPPRSQRRRDSSPLRPTLERSPPFSRRQGSSPRRRERRASFPAPPTVPALSTSRFYKKYLCSRTPRKRLRYRNEIARESLPKNIIRSTQLRRGNDKQEATLALMRSLTRSVRHLYIHSPGIMTDLHSQVNWNDDYERNPPRVSYTCTSEHLPRRPSTLPPTSPRRTKIR